MKCLYQNSWLLIPFAVAASFSMASSAQAGGFAIHEQSVPGLGNSFAGGAAAAEDATTIFFNPAGMTRLQGNSATGGTYLIAPNVRFQNQGSTILTGAPLTGGNGGEAGVDSIVTNFYTSLSLSDRLKIGLGVNTPFGLAIEYQPGWVGRYQALNSRLITINVNPAIAYKVTDTLSVGAGLNIQYAEAQLTNAIDFGLIGRQAGLRTLPQQADGQVAVVGDSWAVGFNLGVLYEATKTTRFGVAYRSAITQELKGEADFTVPTSAALLTRGGRFVDTGASATLKLPDSLAFSAYHELSPQWAVMGDITWTRWSRFEELRVRFDNPLQPDSVQPENWKDTVRLSIGVKYNVDKNLTLRAGFAYDPSPVPRNFETPRLPGGDRTWLSAGLSYQLSPSFSLDISYAHLFNDDSPIRQSSPTSGNLIGTIQSHVDIVGIQINWRF
jgi:long-chain fatty acid transport protein